MFGQCVESKNISRGNKGSNKQVLHNNTTVEGNNQEVVMRHNYFHKEQGRQQQRMTMQHLKIIDVESMKKTQQCNKLS